jgi:hypothetical protein
VGGIFELLYVSIATDDDEICVCGAGKILSKDGMPREKSAVGRIIVEALTTRHYQK